VLRGRDGWFPLPLAGEGQGEGKPSSKALARRVRGDRVAVDPTDNATSTPLAERSRVLEIATRDVERHPSDHDLSGFHFRRTQDGIPRAQSAGARRG